jgi:hypothetical protein
MDPELSSCVDDVFRLKALERHQNASETMIVRAPGTPSGDSPNSDMPACSYSKSMKQPFTFIEYEISANSHYRIERQVDEDVKRLFCSAQIGASPAIRARFDRLESARVPKPGGI